MSDALPPDVRARLRPLRLYARRARASGGLGQHLSRNRGAGLEFAQYRPYEQGDEPRRIDWRLYARSDRYYVRESERDSAHTLWLLVDATASMAQADQAHPDRTKLAAARAVAACALELALRQGERFGVLAFSGGALHGVPAGSGARQRDRCLHELARIPASGAWPDEPALRSLWETIAPESLLLCIGDGFEERFVELATRMAATRREVLHVQILGADEREFPFRGGHRFEDPETGASVATDAPSARAEFLRRFGEARVALARRLAGAGIRHTEHFLDEPPDAPLVRLFPPRAALAAGT